MQIGKKRQINTTQIYETSVRLDAAVMSEAQNDASEWVDDASTELFAVQTIKKMACETSFINRL